MRRETGWPKVSLKAFISRTTTPSLDAECARRAGGACPGRVFETQRQERRDLAVLVLVDVSGSTDGWISGQRRVIDVEREALLLVSHALDALGEPFSIQAFSGESLEFNLMPDALNFVMHLGDAAYDSGLQTFSINLPTVYPGPGYFLVFEQTLVASAVPEPVPVTLYGAGLLGLLGWTARRPRLARR